MDNISADDTMIDPIIRKKSLETHITPESALDIFLWKTVSKGERVVVEKAVGGGAQGGTALVDAVLASGADIGVPWVYDSTSIAPDGGATARLPQQL